LKLVIVRRDDFATFEILRRLYADDADTRVVWDRRLGERRRASQATEAERRAADRRRPPKPWGPMHYVVVQAAG
jgi:hypothetical protein